MGASKLTSWIKSTLAVLLIVTFVVGCSQQGMQTASPAKAPSMATSTGPDAPHVLAAGDALGRRLFVDNTQPSGPAIAKAD